MSVAKKLSALQMFLKCFYSFYEKRLYSYNIVLISGSVSNVAQMVLYLAQNSILSLFIGVKTQNKKCFMYLLKKKNVKFTKLT